MANMLMMRYAARKGGERERMQADRRMGDDPAQDMRYTPPYDGADGDYPEMRRGRDRNTGRYVHRPNRRMELDHDRHIGFGARMDDDDSERDDYPVTSSHYGDSKGGGDIVWLDDEKRRRHGRYEDDGGDDEITKEKAEMWVSNMMGSDPAHPKGGKWSMEAVKPFAQKYGFPTSGREFYEFYVVMNAMYSDYYDVAKKFGVANPDFFAELAKCFIKDKDANPGKVEMYFKHIAKK